MCLPLIPGRPYCGQATLPQGLRSSKYRCMSRRTSNHPRFTTEHQRLATTAAQVTAAFADHLVTLGREREIASRARAAVDVARHAAALDGVGVAAVRRQFVNAAHDQLPFLAVGLDAVPEQLVGDEVCNFVGDCLAKKVFAVFPVQLWVEAQHIVMQMRDTGFLAAQLEADYRAFERALEKGFGLLVTDFDTGVEWLEHASWVSRDAEYAVKGLDIENASCRVVMGRRISL